MQSVIAKENVKKFGVRIEKCQLTYSE